MDFPAGHVYDDRQRQQLSDIVLARLRNLWFENYEANLDLIKRWGGITNIPCIERAVVVGAGFTLQRNIDDLADIPCPVIVCDKMAGEVAKRVKPYIVTALNTQETKVAEWMHAFKEATKAKWGSDALKDVWLVVPVTVHPSTFDHWEGKVAFVNPANTCPELITAVQAETGIDPTIRGDNVGFFSVIVAVALGAKEVAFVGMPYAYRTEEEVLKVTDGFHVVKMKDITKEYVYTTLDWIDSRREFVNFCSDIHQGAGVSFINCSEGGMLYQPGAIHANKLAIWRRHL